MIEKKRKSSVIKVCLPLPFQGGLGAWLLVAAENKR